MYRHLHFMQKKMLIIAFGVHLGGFFCYDYPCVFGCKYTKFYIVLSQLSFPCV